MAQFNWDVNIALAVMRAESGCNPAAHNGHLNSDGTNDSGLFQINSIHVASGLIGDQERFNPEVNIQAAHSIYRGSGWRAWAAFNNGAYQKYL